MQTILIVSPQFEDNKDIKHALRRDKASVISLNYQLCLCLNYSMPFVSKNARLQRLQGNFFHIVTKLLTLKWFRTFV